MNEKQPNRSEKIASNVLRILAIIGLVAVLVLATWTVVQGSRLLPNAGQNISAAISAVKAVFSTAPAESLLFDLENRTLAVGKPVSLAWVYTGENTPENYTFSYSCGTGVKFLVLDDSDMTELACDTNFTVTGATSLTVQPLNDESRFADVTLTISSGDLLDTTAVTIVNTDILSTRDTEKTDETATSSEAVNDNDSNSTVTENTPVSTPVKTYVPPTQSIQPVVTKVVPLYSGPADLVLNIEETGVLVKVSGKNTFFPISPIPDNKVAAVTFTVTNRGGEASKSWVFKAELPVEGDSDYRYTSPVQEPLEPGMQVKYTLGFDEVLQSNKGTIKITLVPTDSSDKKTNNVDTVIVKIDTK